MKASHARFRLIALAAAASLLAACVSIAPPPDVAAPPPAWRDAPGAGVAVQRDWWRGYNDPVLAELVHTALIHNTDLRLAASRVAEARALLDAQGAAQWPTLDLGASATRSRSVSAATGRANISNVSQPQFQAAYEVDLWGRLSALTDAARANLLASETGADSVRLSIAAAVASAYLGLRTSDARLEVAQRTLVSRENALKLAQRRFDTGYTSRLELAQAQAEYRATAQVVPQLQLAIRRQEDALSVLLGRAPQAIARGKALVDIAAPALPAAGVPSQLLRRRPDIAQAEAQIAASDATLAAARAQLLPSLRLTGSLGSLESSLLHGDPIRVWSVGGSVLAPLFNHGRLRAQAQASAARRDQAVLGYQKTVLTAFSEVEDALAAIGYLHEQRDQAQQQQQALAEALRIARNRYNEGYASYLEELDAQRNLFNAELTVLQLQGDALTAEVNLYKALGGGWEETAVR
ncbi:MULTISPECIES: efflux transporter outer membrane subunit [unclassified Lysobacter]|uniref:efflux transporter outer membrane subunit n=1 Tax=unclassified Lysobacter TaxID=2635362 RepID=UPI001BE85064|nr:MULTISPECIES: efflux transporter outer membrane subunit [unclassified Lysobacter]MBT2750123.1 efflux transporter outer membrane subunit [Lysobacter sp. ISL-50]MBT2775305.1 efflux transporter outer membrane subunit [Lysobacter sp. ISL-54]MBT2782679.1 efflux transporter outer membrane subunit [Lysobacter sp. ISL-52]